MVRYYRLTLRNDYDKFVKKYKNCQENNYMMHPFQTITNIVEVSIFQREQFSNRDVKITVFKIVF